MRIRAPLSALIQTIAVLVIPTGFPGSSLVAAPPNGEKPPTATITKTAPATKTDSFVTNNENLTKKAIPASPAQPTNPPAQKQKRTILSGANTPTQVPPKGSEKSAFPEPLPKRVILLTDEENEQCACAQTDLSEVISEIVSNPISIKFDPPPSNSQPKKLQAPNKSTYKVLVLGDSLGLCGFGKSLDSKLRGNNHITSVATYMACGTIPSSWLKIGPYSTAKTACGFWSIESQNGSPPTESKDTYGMTMGHKPSSHPVPKIESLLERYNPDILVMQNGTNLLSLFSDGTTVIPARHDAQLRSHLAPFLKCVTNASHSLKKIYWVAPPVSGRYSKETQDFLVEKLSLYGGPVWEVIDSRELVPYPYKRAMPDKEHFVGKEMDTWAQKVYDRIAKDMSEAEIPSTPLSKHKNTEALRGASSLAATKTNAQSRREITVRARLTTKSRPLTREEILPYQESLVGHVYSIEDVLSGEYHDAEILVMHPAHIKLKEEPLEKYAVGETYKLELVDFEGSVWESIKRSDSTGKLDLLPFIQKEDEARAHSLKR
jgi:hypothetical protein